VKLHCAALAEGLLESELFGHEKGSFTGAVARRQGRLELADRGTLFLDEVGELSPATQVKLLRFLQEHELERVGGNATIKVDARVVAATHQDLAQAVRAGRFREDLYYRLKVVPIELPPLRERHGDVRLLASAFTTRLARANEKAIAGLADDAVLRLEAYAWPGNVRELENVIERAVVLARGDRIEGGDLPAWVGPQASDGVRAPAVPGASLPELERYAILQTLAHTAGSTRRAAAVLGMSRRKLQYRLRQYRQEERSLSGPAP
jgi:transcriptional regulator with GAF, ATPase, and Fis domain